ncbi:MAG: threonylcarbamoyl-AMP synthase [Cardiobacteriaceae bacterium]|nr:threonylcarbamoyl-AMP synthase [Cardiobacteriaceae bacterium]
MTKIIEADRRFLKPAQMTQVLEVIQNGGVIIAPTDSGYALLCRLGDKQAASKIRLLRELDKNHPFTLLCHDLSQLSVYARVDNVQFRLLKAIFPGAFTCILPASREVPRLVQHEKRKTIGIRVPESDLINKLIAAHGEALMGVSLFSSDDECLPIDELPRQITNSVDLIIDCGEIIPTPSTVCDLTSMPPEILRQGRGDLSQFL